MPPVSALVIGSINIDLVVRAGSLPRAGVTMLADSMQRGPGGKGANQAVCLARLGADVAMVGAVGDDGDGVQACRALEAEGIDTSMVETVEERTGTAIVHLDRAGQNTITVVAGANTSVDAGIHMADLSGDRTFDCAVLQLEIPVAAVVDAIASVRDRTPLVVLNAAPPAPLPRKTLAAVDVLVVNEDEALTISGAPTIEEAAEALAGQTRRGVVVTLGSAGALWIGGGETHQVPAPEVEVVDTTGAGDSFVAVLAYALASGRDPASAVRAAVGAASMSVTTSGAQGFQPDPLALGLA